MTELTQEYLKECLHYSPDTGVFTWLERPLEHFKSDSYFKSWNRKYSGKVAGSAKKQWRTSYILIRINSKTYRAHRLAWLHHQGEFPKNQIDHIDGNGLNNKINNLRDVTHGENMRNKRLQLNNTSGVKGVYWRKLKQKWQADICISGKRNHLGYFKNKEDAAAARKEAELKHGYTHII